MSVVGTLAVLLRADSAQIVSDLGKARSAVRSAVGDMQAGAQRAMESVTGEIRGVGPALAGLQPATLAATKSLELMGMKGSAAVTGLASGLRAMVVGGFTPLTVAAAGAVAAVGLLATQAPRVEGAMAATEERLKSTAEALTRVREELDLVRGGGSGSSRDVDVAMARTELERRRAELAAFDRGAVGNALSGAVSMVGGEDKLRELRRRVQEQEALIATLEETASVEDSLGRDRKRKQEEEAAAAKSRAEAAQRALQADRDAAVSTRQLIELTRAQNEQLAERTAALNALESGQDPDLARQRARVALAQQAADRASREGATGDEVSRMTALLELERRQLGLLEREKALAVSVQAETEEVLVLHEERAGIDEWLAEMQQDRVYLTREEREELERQVRAREALADQAADALRLDKEASAERSRAVMTAGSGGGPGPLGEAFLLGADRGLVDGMARSLDGLARGATSAQGAVRSFAASFVDAMQQIAAQQAALGLVRAAFSMFGYASPAPGQLASGSAPAVNVTSTLPATGAAHGGEFRVIGTGGLDSQYVRMRLSPGELVRVTDGAAGGRRGDGGFHGTLVVRPPAVVANEVAARMDPSAKAGIVASATARPGRRAERAAG